jgi:peptide/nickel transport system substrate-binding protein
MLREKEMKALAASIIFLSLMASLSSVLGDEWIPYVPQAQYVQLYYWMQNGISYMNVSITFASSGFNVSDWGMPFFDGNSISVDSKIWMYTGYSFPWETVLSNTYNLGKLQTGQYTFIFKAWGNAVKNITFTVCLTSNASAFEPYGPRMDGLLIKFPANFTLLELDEVDIVDRSLPKELIDKWSNSPYNETIALEEYDETGMYVLDINNNETIPTYPNWRSPTSYPEFRHAIAHLVNRTKIIAEILDGYGIALTTPVFPWLEKWFNPQADAHPYDPLEAANILDQAGFVQGSTENPYYDPSKPGSAQFIRVYPPSHEKAGQDLDPLIFYVRYDNPERNATAYMIRDELLSSGIPVIIPPPSIRIQEIVDKVWRYGDYHLYTGGWSLSIEPDYMYSLYHSSQHGYLLPNYNNVHDGELDYWLERLLGALTQDEAVLACKEAQRRMAEIVGVIPLWAPVRVKAYNRNWQGVINEECVGVDSWWTFLSAHPEGVEFGGTMRYGLSMEIQSLNPVFGAWHQDWLVLDKIYDTLIKRNPFNVTEATPWMARSYMIEKWDDNKTKLVFELRENIQWHDGENFTSQDVKFTIEYLKSFWENPNWGLPLPTFYWNVEAVDHIETPDPYIVIIYMDIPSIWSLYSIGEVPILPKHVWENISEPLGFAPDNQLIGSGPFKFTEYVEGDHVLLTANTNYFRYLKINLTVKPKIVNFWKAEPLVCILEVLGFCDANTVELSSIMIKTPANIANLTPKNLSFGDWNENGIPDIAIELNSTEIIGYIMTDLMENARNYKFFRGFAFPISLTINGQVSGMSFEISDKTTVVSNMPAIPI